MAKKKMWNRLSRKAAYLASAAAGTIASQALADDLPQGGNVVEGSAAIQQAGAHQLTINQSSENAIINWQSFDIGSGALVQFIQPDQHAAALNRVTGDTASSIAGSLTANGTVLLINPNGISIGPGAVINTGSFTASTLDISDLDFLSGHYNFRAGKRGVVSNAGTITARDGGSVALLGSVVINSGVVEARMGHVAFGAGDLITLDFAGDGFMSVGVSADQLANALGVQPSALGTVTSSGDVRADGGRILISASAARELMLGAVNIPGNLVARSVTTSDGHIVLGGVDISAAGDVNLGGAVDVSGQGGAGGGSVRVDANNGVLTATAAIDASGGGSVELNARAVALGGPVNADGATGGSVRISASGDISLASAVSARGANGAGGVVTYQAGGSVFETTTGSTDVSGATDGGQISLIAGYSVLSSGAFNAAGGIGAGGRIDVTGAAVNLFSANFDASGGAQGGVVRLGGALHGGGASGDADGFAAFGNVTDPLPSAQTTFVNDSTTINVSSSHGRGGAAVIWSDQQTTMLGAIEGAGALSGGYAEISSAGTLRQTDLGGVHLGVGGRLLLDPKNIVIGSFAQAVGWQYQGIIGSAGGSLVNLGGASGSGDNTGVSVALNAAGDRLAIGSSGDDGFGDGLTDSGAVRLFSFSDTTFGGGAFVGTIGASYVGGNNIDLSSTLTAGDAFGSSLALNAAGDRMAVGAVGDDGATDSLADSGAVRLFSFGSTNFTGGVLTATIGQGYSGAKDINLTTLDAGDHLGGAVALNAAGNLLAVGAPGDDGAANTFVDVGSARLITFSDANFSGGTVVGTAGVGYTGTGDINVQGLVVNNSFGGSALALNAAGDRLAVGLPGAPSGGGVGLIAFSNTSFGGASVIGVIAPGFVGGNNVNASGYVTAGDQFGSGLALNAAGTILAVGAAGDDSFDNSLTDSGAVRIYTFTDGSFHGGALNATIGRGYTGGNDLDLGSAINAGDLFGSSVALNAAGDRLVAGASGAAGGGDVTLFANAGVIGGHYGDNPSGTTNISNADVAAVLSAGTSIDLQASNDITVNSAISPSVSSGGGALTLEAGRSILVNADISTGGGALTLLGNAGTAAGVIDAQRDSGAATITMASGVTLNAGGGNVSITLSNGAGQTDSTTGSITLSSISGSHITALNRGATGDIVLNTGSLLTASGSGVAIRLGSQNGTFTNNAGASVFSLTGGGTYAIYANDPASALEGVTGYAKRYAVSFSDFLNDANVPSGNRIVYAVAPTLSVSADNLGKVYGDSDPSLTYAVNSGLIDSDSVVSALSGLLVRGIGENVGSYAIGQGGLTSPLGYTISFTSGLFSISARPITITADSLSRSYGDANPALTGHVSSGSLVNGDAVTGSGASSATTASGVGGYAITQGTLGAGANYDVSFVAGQLTITPRPITITADSLSRLYGDANPGFTGHVTSGN
ncbi:MAG: MBG domain-containing protein, partial [Terricaulis silvestris]